MATSFMRDSDLAIIRKIAFERTTPLAETISWVVAVAEAFHDGHLRP